jgi:hypothetical protein
MERAEGRKGGDLKPEAGELRSETNPPKLSDFIAKTPRSNRRFFDVFSG